MLCSLDVLPTMCSGSAIHPFPALLPSPGLVVWVWTFQSRTVYQFSIADTTNSHKLGGLKQHIFIISQFRRSPNLVSLAPNQDISRSAFLLQTQGEFISRPFLVSRSCLHSLACGSIPSSKPDIGWLDLSHATSL